MSQTFKDYLHAHSRETLLYGVPPLSSKLLQRLYIEGRSSAFAFSVAADVNAGFGFQESIKAAERAGL